VDVTVDIHFTGSGESGIAKAIEAQLRQSTDKPEEDRLAIVFDPDVRSVAELEEAVDSTLRLGGFTWVPDTMDRLITVGARTMLLRIIPWRSPDPVVGGLDDKQNLDRLLCAVAARAFPADAPIVTRWLGEARDAGKQPGWKAAVHLWCALVAEKQSETNAAAHFLHQDKTCRQHVQPTLALASLETDAAWLFLP
jgi:hypothetical protein